MKCQKLCCLLFLLLLPAVSFAMESLRLATTTSTDNSGLLAELLPPFEEANGCRVDVIAVGTGKALKLGQSGDVDVVLVHARSREDRFVAEGFGVDRRDVMYNDFVVIGPSRGGARLKGVSEVTVALQKIADSGATFVSRGDDSGTHTRERQLWDAAGVEPDGSWYLEAGRGMGDVLVMTDEKQGYTLSDRGTFLAMREKLELGVVFEKDPRLLNPYGLIMVNPDKHPHINAALAKRFLDYLTSAQAKELITGFRRNGDQLFHVE